MDARTDRVFAIPLRNKAHTLPWFLYYLQHLDYPKQRMRLWIRSDHNADNSVELVQEWLSHVKHEYNHVDFVDDNSETEYSDSQGPFDWSALHVGNMLKLRQQALNDARAAWADFILLLDADNLLVNNQVLRALIKENRRIITPMLNSTASENYSNFWGGFDENGYYRRTENYIPIKSRHLVGVHSVALVHSTVLVQLRDPMTLALSYDPPPPGYTGPVDDIIIFAHSAVYHGLSMDVVNKDFYGYTLVPMESHNTLDEEREQFVHTKLENLVTETPLQKLDYMNTPGRPLEKYNFDQIYLINLDRRMDRRVKMEQCLAELFINASLVSAVDGRTLNDSYLKHIGIKMMDGYADPYGGRQMTMGEIGCFLSHYNIWQDVLNKQYSSVIVFEDDVRFRPYFPQRLRYLLHDLQALNVDWDLVYLGRKRLKPVEEEPYVGESRILVWPEYTYWTLGYMLSNRGARKLVEQRPLGKMIPVDEYLPIMFDKHPQDGWKGQFEPRDLVALSAYPLLVEPTHYTGEPGYITDTEDSPIIDETVTDKQKGDDGMLSVDVSLELRDDGVLGGNLGDEL